MRYIKKYPDLVGIFFNGTKEKKGELFFKKLPGAHTFTDTRQDAGKFLTFFLFM